MVICSITTYYKLLDELNTKSRWLSAGQYQYFFPPFLCLVNVIQTHVLIVSQIILMFQCFKGVVVVGSSRTN